MNNVLLSTFCFDSQLIIICGTEATEWNRGSVKHADVVDVFVVFQDGEVIGINCITVAAASGISFAIPSDIANEFLGNAKKRTKELKESPSGLVANQNETREIFYIGNLRFSLC